MYIALRTWSRPPKIVRLPRIVSESRLNGAIAELITFLAPDTRFTASSLETSSPRARRLGSLQRQASVTRAITGYACPERQPAHAMTSPVVTFSVVSHAQNALVNQLIIDVSQHCAGNIALVLTENTADAVPFATTALAAPCEVIVNAEPKGYGANHNAAFARCRTPYFCVANPDLRLPADPFPSLLKTLDKRHAGVVGPLVRSPAGGIEDSARHFPTLGIVLRKLLCKRPGPDYPVDRGPIEVDWIAGMFMLFQSDTYREIGGFDEAYFLYYEDVDLCHRLRKAGKAVIYDPAVEVVHDARRTSRRHPRLALRHIASAFRYLSRS